jgi:hypothetical protein
METNSTLGIPIISQPSAEQALSTALGSNPIVAIASSEESKALLQITGQLWRQGTILIDSESGEPKNELSPQDIRKLSHALETMRELIKNLGIRVIDRCNEDFHPGLPDTVVTEETHEGISKERIIRTIRPTIMWGQTMVQRGEIDIAVPVNKKADK